MSNLAEGIREKAEKRGERRGERRGIAIGEKKAFDVLLGLATDGIISLAEAARRAGTTEAEFIEKTGIRL